MPVVEDAPVIQEAEEVPQLPQEILDRLKNPNLVGSPTPSPPPSHMAQPPRRAHGKTRYSPEQMADIRQQIEERLKQQKIDLEQHKVGVTKNLFLVQHIPLTDSRVDQGRPVNLAH